jgi:hypothetical protein
VPLDIPFSLRIFVADGDPDGLRIVDKSNWIGKALVFPRALLPQVKARPELAQTGESGCGGPVFTAFLSHSRAMGLRMRQKLSSPDPLFASTPSAAQAPQAAPGR